MLRTLLFWKKRNRDIKFLYASFSGPKLRRYYFPEPPDGFLSYRYDYSVFTRRFLLFLKKIVKLILDNRCRKLRVNQYILKELDLPLDTDVTTLDAYYRREFKKKRKLFYSKSRPNVVFPEPEKTYIEFLPSPSKVKNKNFSIEFFQQQYQEESVSESS
ncbi:ABC transporter, ATP binding protein [Mycoplasma haemocanis str. Illinois]|uniref:ABC transporter, ATP binding protein n=1 Tax=Mycoplasma haemocanis (strain Illinois) TaxID=1111676 RepID=H6N8L2_MYCHN|nr:hypothetical protein [Mycoplasma haemocanis]AEW45984.1 ABC transporter, ATP binding protein [Mycoplasma haemocanis str. Illinois]